MNEAVKISGADPDYDRRDLWGAIEGGDYHTQLKRLGGPNFTHILVNAPRCPVHSFQQDGDMAMHNPRGRADYELNGWGAMGGPRENPVAGY